MTTLETGSKPADPTNQRDTAADGYVQGWSVPGPNVQSPDVQGPNAQGPNAQGPMSQQAAFSAHGYDIYPQTFVRLVGCHQSNATKYEAARPLRTAA
jgi:hypothetical protein